MEFCSFPNIMRAELQICWDLCAHPGPSLESSKKDLRVAPTSSVYYFVTRSM